MTAVDICNRALMVIGEAPNITAIDPADGSAHADLCAERFDSAVEVVNEARHWTFADRRKALAKVTVAVTSATAATDLITTTAAHGLEDNNRVTLEVVSGSAPGGLTDGETYYVIVASTTTVKLTDEEDGDAIDITSAGGTIRLLKESDRAGAEFMYALPTDCLTERALLPAGAPDDWPGMSSALVGTPYSGIGVVASSSNGLNYSHGAPGFGEQRFIPAKRALNTALEQVIYCNLEDAELLYSAFIEDVTQWSPHFREAVTFQLAASLAGAIKRDVKLVDWCLSRAQMAISEASRIDAQRVLENRPRRYPWCR